METYTFQYFPRNQRLSADHKACLDQHARQMAKLMIQKQEDFRYYERLVEFNSYHKEKHQLDSGIESSSSSCEKSTEFPPPVSPTLPLPPQASNPFFKTRHVINWLESLEKWNTSSDSSSDSGFESNSSGFTSPSTSPTPVNLVPNPFFNPVYAMKSSVQSSQFVVVPSATFRQ